MDARGDDERCFGPLVTDDPVYYAEQVEDIRQWMGRCRLEALGGGYAGYGAT